MFTYPTSSGLRASVDRHETDNESHAPENRPNITQKIIKAVFVFLVKSVLEGEGVKSSDKLSYTPKIENIRAALMIVQGT
jgi:hypothetical protein